MDLIITDTPRLAQTLSKFAGSNYMVYSVSPNGVPPFLYNPTNSQADQYDCYSVHPTFHSRKHEFSRILESATTVFFAFPPNRYGGWLAHLLKSFFGIKNAKLLTLYHIDARALSDAIDSASPVLPNHYLSARAKDTADAFLYQSILDAQFPASSIVADMSIDTLLFLFTIYSQNIQDTNKSAKFKAVLDLESKNNTLKATWIPDYQNPNILYVESKEEANNALSPTAFYIADFKEKEISLRAPYPFNYMSLLRTACESSGLLPYSTIPALREMYDYGYISFYETYADSFTQETTLNIRNYLSNSMYQHFVRTDDAIIASQSSFSAIHPIDIAKLSVFSNSETLLTLYSLIHSRALASEMYPAIISEQQVIFNAKTNLPKPYLYKATFYTTKKRGWLKLLPNDPLECPYEITESVPLLPVGEALVQRAAHIVPSVPADNTVPIAAILDCMDQLDMYNLIDYQAVFNHCINYDFIKVKGRSLQLSEFALTFITQLATHTNIFQTLPSVFEMIAEIDTAPATFNETIDRLSAAIKNAFSAKPSKIN